MLTHTHVLTLNNPFPSMGIHEASPVDLPRRGGHQKECNMLGVGTRSLVCIGRCAILH